MENNGREILDEIKAEIASLRSRLDELEQRLSFVKDLDTFDEPIDFDPEDLPAEVAPVEDIPVEYLPAEDLPAEDLPVEDLPAEEPAMILVAEPESEPEPAPEPAPKPKKAAPEASPYAWRTDMAGSPVANIISGISLNDRVLFINTLFSEDPILFQASLARFNAMNSLQEAEDYIAANFPGWNLSSEVVYRFMMAVRRKLK